MFGLARSVVLVAVIASVGCTERLRQTAAPEDATPGPAHAPSRATMAAEDPAPAPVATALPVLVELFTSEGCSSCPPADALLRTVATDMAARGVVALSFHVDYWNSLGWPDPFSSGAYTRRQEAYARVLGGAGLYTPEMVVGGRDAFVGSDRAHALGSIEKALTRRAVASVTLDARPPAGRVVDASYAVRGAPPGVVLHVALAERGLTSHVPRGENAGRTLQHENVVRAFETVRLGGSAEGRVRLEAPPRTELGRSFVVAFVQDPGTMEILGGVVRELGG